MNDMQMGPPAGGDLAGTLIVVVGAIATLFAFVAAFRATVWPGETAPDHPKHLILRDDR
jgi:hypothetical protein